MARLPPLILGPIAAALLLSAGALSGPVDAADGCARGQRARLQCPAAPAPPPNLPRGAKAPETKKLVSANGMAAADYAACVSELASRKVSFERVGDMTQQGCELSGAIRLTAVATPFGDVGIAGNPAMLCGFARQFSGWVREVVAPLTLAYTGRRLARIEIGSSFACRARTDKPGEIPSEHAKGDAVDIASFVLADGRAIVVKKQDVEIPMARDLVRAMRTAACGYFTTILGPGSDPAHEDHLHFDTLVHGATPNYRICE